MDEESFKRLRNGDCVLACVVRPPDQDFRMILSLRMAAMEKDWRAAQDTYESEECFDAVVSGYNKGGLIVHVGEVRGFVPASHLSALPRGSYRELPEEESPLASWVGRELHLKIIEVDRRRNRLILSERAAVRGRRRDRKDELLAELTEGEIREGVVASICDFGAFVDLGGADGLVHLSELAWGRVGHPSEVVHVGQKLRTYVLGVDQERKRIALSLKRLQPEPWARIEENYHVDQLVQGTITRLTSFGAFARLDDDIEGLIHISELSNDRISHPSEIVCEGDICTLQIIRVDGARRRIGLSLRRALRDSSPETDPEGGAAAFGELSDLSARAEAAAT
jgi:small subunit ribosomal protein S1